MTIKTEFNDLTTKDIYSLMLFTLYKMKDIPEYSALSELSYIVDADTLLKLCEYYGGMTIRIPTIKELELVLNALLLYQFVDIEGKNYEQSLDSFGVMAEGKHDIQNVYCQIKKVLRDYNFSTGR